MDTNLDLACFLLSIQQRRQNLSRSPLNFSGPILRFSLLSHVLNLASFPKRLALAALLTCTLPLSACATSQQKRQAHAVLREVLALRRSPMPSKRHHIDKLKSLPCTEPPTCQARDTCADAFEHLVSSWEIGHEIEKQLGTQEARTKSTMQTAKRNLLRMNIEVDTAGRKLGACDQATARLRSKYGQP